MLLQSSGLSKWRVLQEGSIQSVAQTAGVLAVKSLGLEGTSKLVYFMAVDEAKFRAPVEPGVLMELHVEFVQKRATVCMFAGRAVVDGKVVALANFTAMIADRRWPNCRTVTPR